jgi:hypothetical protein
MAHTLRRTPAYRRARADLRFSARLLLPQLEARIADNPSALPPNAAADWFRFEVMLGGRLTTVEHDPSGLLIFFRVVLSEVVMLDLIVDLLDPPDWFLQPIGTWAEGLVDVRGDDSN